MEDPKLPNIANDKVPQQDDTQLEILKQLKRQNALLEEQLALQKREKHKIDTNTLPILHKSVSGGGGSNSFVKPRLISDELCSFMGIPANSQKSQTDVTKFISVYVKSHSCFDPMFRRRICPDSKLAKLLRITDKDELTYLNLQSFLKIHFIKLKK